jgi:MFS family permease
LRPNDPYAPLRRAPFRAYLGGALATSLSNQILKVTAGYYLYETTHSAWALALMGLMSYLPILLLSLPAGWASDHFPRRRVMGLALCLEALAAMGLCALMGLGGPSWPWYPLLFLAGCGRALMTPASVSLYPQLLEAHEVPRGVSWNSANFQIGAVLGPILGGLLVHWLGVPHTLYFVLAGPAMFAALLPALASLRELPAPAPETVREKLLGGFSFVWSHKPILGALSVDFVAVLFGGVEGILPMFALDILGCGSVGQGALMAAPFLGAFLMSFRLAHRPVLPRPGRAMLWAVGGFGICMLIFGLSRRLDLSLAALLASGMLDQISVYVRQTMVQMRTPEALRGRVQAVNFLFIGSSNELGECESGITAGLLGPVGSVMLGAVAVLVVVLGAGRVFPELLNLPSLEREGGAEA